MINLFVSKLFKSLNKYKIKYAILRNYKSMPSKPRDTKYFDLDIIVLSKDLKKFNEILNKTINKDNALLFKTFKRSYCHHYRVIKFKKKKLDNIQIDVHTKGQGYLGFFYMLENEILDSRKKYKNFYVVSDFHMNLFNWIDKLQWGHVKPKYSNPIKKNMNKNIELLELFLKKRFLKKQTILSIKKIFTNPYKKTENTIKYKNSILISFILWSVIKHPIKTIIWTIEFIYREIILRIFPPGLFLILKKNKKFNKDLFKKLSKTAIMGQEAKLISLNKENKLNYLSSYINIIWPVVRKHGLVVCIYNNEFVGKKTILKKNFNYNELIKYIIYEYKKPNFIGFPNLVIDNK